jgi:hypothetical protein
MTTPRAARSFKTTRSVPLADSAIDIVERSKNAVQMLESSDKLHTKSEE